MQQKSLTHIPSKQHRCDTSISNFRIEWAAPASLRERGGEQNRKRAKNDCSTWTRRNQTQQIMHPSQWRRVHNMGIRTWINKYRQEKCLPPTCGELYIATLSALCQECPEIGRGEHKAWMTQHWHSPLLWCSKSGDDELVMLRGLWVCVCVSETRIQRKECSSFVYVLCVCVRESECVCVLMPLVQQEKHQKSFLSLTHTGIWKRSWSSVKP